MEVAARLTGSIRVSSSEGLLDLTRVEV